MLVFPAGNAYLIAPGLASNPTGPGFLPFIKPANANIVGAANGAYRDENGNVLASADYSSLQPNTIVVAGVDRNNVISAFSNRCGVAAAWCMVAPDEDIFTTTVDNPNTLDIVETYTTVTGTSFAAPQVAGLLALLKQQFPNLTHPQIVARALNTATDLGAAGVDAIYGHGLLNVAAATNPVGVTGISTNGLLGGNYRSLASSTISYGSAFGSNAASAFNNVGVVFLDQDNAAFLANMGSMTRSTAQQFNTNEAFDRFARPAERQEIDMGSNTKVGFSTERNTVSDHVVGDNPREEGNTGLSFRSFSLTQSVSNETQGSVHYKDSSALMLGFSDGDRARVDRAINKNALSNPYASFAGNGFASVIKTEGLGGTIKVAGFFGNSENDSEARNFGTQAELGYNLDKGADAYVSFGTLFEGNRVLGSKGEGALAFGNGTGTVYMGLGGKYSLDTTTTLHVAGYAGMTNPSVDADNSLIKQASEIITSSFNASVERAGQFTKGDSVGFGISQPLRVESGNMQFAIPVALAVDGDYSSLLSSNFTQDLSAQGREMDLQFNYAFPMGKDETITMGALYRMDAGHVAGKDDMLGLTRWSKKF